MSVKPKKKATAGRGSHQRRVRGVQWRCSNCNRTGAVKVDRDEQLHYVCAVIYAAHNKNWNCMCPAWAMHVSL